MVDIIRRKVEANPNKVFIKKGRETYTFQRKIDALETAVTINPQDYALIQEGNQAVCAMSMIQGYNGDNQENTIISVLKDGLTTPTLAVFMQHYKNANDALKRKSVLYDASGDLIEKDRLKKYVHTLNHDSWSWLNGGFVKGSGFNGLDLRIIAGLDKEGCPVFKKFPLEDTLAKDCFVELGSLNSQGFPTEKASVQECRSGKISYFWAPKEGATIRFYSDFSVIYLVCNGNPLSEDPELGAFTCVDEKRTESQSPKNK